ncbi:MAG: DUF2804 domain-containing protein [Pyrinomonadaceae bacterium]|nr:DUF2804 domain-containing protein [Pyrinomonadaceae bacterium]
MTFASIDQPYRGSGVDRPRGVPLPPERVPLLRAGQLRKRWHYVSFWSRELSFCAARASVGPLAQEYWGIWDREAQEFREGSHRFTNRVQLDTDRVQVRDDNVEIALKFEPCTSFEVYRPAGKAYIWSHKDYCQQAQGSVRYNERTRPVKGVMFVDINAGYHERQTHWRWAAGAGLDQHDRLVAFNAITGLFDTPDQSERTIWIEDDAKEVGPNSFAEDLSTVSFAEGGTLRFQPEALIEHHDNFLLIRSDYFHWFGTYTGTLPGGIELREAYGVRERHNALW